MARARHLAAAVTAFMIGGAILAAGIGTASAHSGPDLPKLPGVPEDLPKLPGLPEELPTCLVPLPLLCGEPPQESPPDSPAPEESWTPPKDSVPPYPEASGDPWRPAAEHEHKVPRGHPETGGGGLTTEGAAWPYALGGVAVLTGAGLAGLAVRRRRDVA
ncbi:hypothetical protein ACTMTI_42320 [Nonomuraea sp. H19]|uniref:hypothetical protein n=1 Tax=Nonomuraea sp. H19 TaxID=3452206 RepID=UPI003F8C2436